MWRAHAISRGGRPLDAGTRHRARRPGPRPSAPARSSGGRGPCDARGSAHPCAPGSAGRPRRHPARATRPRSRPTLSRAASRVVVRTPPGPSRDSSCSERPTRSTGSQPRAAAADGGDVDDAQVVIQDEDRRPDGRRQPRRDLDPVVRLEAEPCPPSATAPARTTAAPARRRWPRGSSPGPARRRRSPPRTCAVHDPPAQVRRDEAHLDEPRVPVAQGLEQASLLVRAAPGP